MLSSPGQLGYIPERIISVVPSQTELLFDLGLDNSVTGISKFCVQPAHWRKIKTIVGGTKNINTQKVNACNPDLIIVNKEENEKDQVELLADRYNVWMTAVTNLTDAMQMIRDIGILSNTQLKASKIVAEIEECFSQMAALPKRLKACYLIWRDPYMTVGGDTFIHDMLCRCGFDNIYGTEKRYPAIDINNVKERGCNLLLLSSEPYPFKQQHVYELQQLLPLTKILLVDGQMFSWYGSRLLYAPGYFSGLIKNVG